MYVKVSAAKCPANPRQIKTLSPLRSSDRRKTADRIIDDYNLHQPVDDDASPDSKAAATVAHTKLRNALLPDNALSAKFTTTSGPTLKVVSGTVYVGSHGAGEQRVLWVKIEERLYPTGGCHLCHACRTIS